MDWRRVGTRTYGRGGVTPTVLAVPSPTIAPTSIRPTSAPRYVVDRRRGATGVPVGVDARAQDGASSASSPSSVYPTSVSTQELRSGRKWEGGKGGEGSSEATYKLDYFRHLHASLRRHADGGLKELHLPALHRLVKRVLHMRMDASGMALNSQMLRQQVHSEGKGG
ncbi:hypothetical protein FIBSPDRAFT_889258 [Athelia psychrophila]|uniref:Uncharacterized protein n=1 Tax=Athelia psychrophila TaxID=1759441 RepID=A0A166MIY6_9AGAM|nr:hypothetical protein FIBSPDRAFT_889258 [Fibularhizoctonia sp. CBS 109695]